MVDINTRIASLNQPDVERPGSQSGVQSSANALAEAVAQPQSTVRPSVSVDLSLEAIQIAEAASFTLQATPNDQVNFRNDNVVGTSESSQESQDELATESNTATDISQVLPPPEEGEFTPQVAGSVQLQQSAEARDARAPASGREDVISFATPEPNSQPAETEPVAVTTSPNEVTGADENRERLERQIAVRARQPQPESVATPERQDAPERTEPQPRADVEPVINESAARERIVQSSQEPSRAEVAQARASDTDVAAPAEPPVPNESATPSVTPTNRAQETETASNSLAEADARPEPETEENVDASQNQGTVLRQFNVSAEDSLGTSLDTNA